MKTTLLSVFATLAAISLWAADPVISDSSVVVTKGSDLVLTIDYTLENAAAIVTVDFLTNGVSIGELNFVNVGGDVNRVIAPGARKIFWKTDRGWVGHHETGALTAKVTAWALTNPPEIMVVDFRVKMAKKNVRFYTSTNALPEGGLANRPLYAITNVVFKRIHSGGKRFRMGCPSQYSNYSVDAPGRSPQCYVTLSQDFYLGVYPLTCGQARQYLTSCRTAEYYGSYSTKPMVPCPYLSYQALRGSVKGYNWPNDDGDTKAYEVDATYPWGSATHPTVVGAFRTLTGLTRVDLPTHAQWEFAARAGTTHHFYELDGLQYDVLNDYETNPAQLAFAKRIGWNKASGVSDYQDVGQLEPNGYGLYDMAGNIYEVVLDRNRDNYYLNQFVTDPVGSPTGDSLFCVGGMYNGHPNNCRVWAASNVARNSPSAACGARLAAPIDVSVLAE